MKNTCGKVLSLTLRCGDKHQGQEGDCYRCEECKAKNDSEAKDNWLKEKKRLKNRARRGK